MVDLSVYGGLFAVALVAATLFPLQSEALLAGLLIAGKQPVWMLVAVASVGNVVGSTINWAMGRSIEKLRERRWFPIKPRALERAENWYRRFGRWTLLLSWTPVIGDPHAGSLFKRLSARHHQARLRRLSRAEAK